MKNPAKSKEIRACVNTLARYLDAEGAPILIKQRLYSHYLRALERAEVAFPALAIRSEGAQALLAEQARKQINARAVRGAGVSF